MYNIVQAGGSAREQYVYVQSSFSLMGSRWTMTKLLTGVRKRTQQQQKQHGLGGNSLLWHLFVLVLWNQTPAATSTEGRKKNRPKLIAWPPKSSLPSWSNRISSSNRITRITFPEACIPLFLLWSFLLYFLFCFFQNFLVPNDDA